MHPTATALTSSDRKAESESEARKQGDDEAKQEQ